MVRPRRPSEEPRDDLPRGDGNYVIAQALNRLVEYLQREEQSRAVQAGCTYERFLAHRTPAFTGEEDPLRAEKWIRDLEKTFEVCGCTEAQQVLYASYLLQGTASDWWETKREMLVLELGSFAAVTWQRFKKKFNDRFFPAFVRRQKAREFTNLVQGSMTVEQYARRFVELGRFATHLIAAEEMQAEYFQEGLRPDIRRMVVCHRITIFQELVDLATLAEREINLSMGSPTSQKRQSFTGGGSSSGSPQKFVQRTGTRPQAAPGVRMGGRVPFCGRCNRANEGECWQSGRTQCYCCSQEGHFARECPNRVQGSREGRHSGRTNQRQVVQARVYAVTPGEVDDEAPATHDAGVITGITLCGRRGLYGPVTNPSAAENHDSSVPHLQVFRLSSITEATNNFSIANKMGEGGFGSVYKGKLPRGQVIAVKRLSKTSTQGHEEFANEVTLTARLQHVNLVRVIGFCTENEEKMLIYEYMPNKSLNFYIFDPIGRRILDWRKRVHIIEGIIQGLLYLQEHSNFTIIHRDLKGSNILLDKDMNPKISDFGIAKLFGKDEHEANTDRIVGTYGYVPPEYVRKGTYSMKYDVYSFGVLLLQIISGKRNACYYGANKALDLLEYAYELWREGEGMEFMDPSLDDSSSPCKLVRCLQVALLCVQENPVDRPTMLEVYSMLINDNGLIATPQKPAFPIKTDENVGSSSTSQQ